MNITIGYIYKIICLVSGKLYIGSTFKNVDKRLVEHVSAYKRYINGKKSNYVTSYDIIKNGNYKVECIESFENIPKQELKQHERKYILTTPNIVNKNLPCRSAKELYFQLRDKRLEQFHKYYENNKSRVAKRMRLYYLKNKETILNGRRQNRNKMKLTISQ